VGVQDNRSGEGGSCSAEISIKIGIAKEASAKQIKPRVTFLRENAKKIMPKIIRVSKRGMLSEDITERLESDDSY
jgi:hypothetical protein